jgi:Cellulose biosynthesis protein BcsS
MARPAILFRAFKQLLPCAAAALLVLSTVALAASDDDEQGPPDEAFHGIALPGETWIGAEGFGRVWSIYSGANYAPFGAMNEGGFRLRAVTGMSGYKYTSPRWTGAKTEPVAFQGQGTFVDALAGYHARYGNLTAKVFVGATYTNHRTGTANLNFVAATGSIRDNETRLNGQHYGAKTAIELWFNLSERIWSSADISLSTLNIAYTGNARLAWRVTPELSGGGETGTVGFTDRDEFNGIDVRRQTTRFGAFVRYDNQSSEVIVSGGLSQARGDVATPYATAQYLARF